jgi:3D (Asp-Asp-Asp) domain-containing protein
LRKEVRTKLGTKFWSPSLGIFLKATDTGGAIKGPNRMDIAVSADQKKVDAWGHLKLDLQKVK